MCPVAITRPVSLGQPARKPLYLASETRVDLSVADNALVIRQAGRAPRRVPLNRLTRIICNRAACWSSDAIIRCLAAEVVIAWVDGHGRQVGCALPQEAHADTLPALLERYVELPDWTTRFDNWLTRRRLETLTFCMREALEQGRDIQQRGFETLKREYVYKGQHAQQFNPEGLGWLQAFVVDQLQRQTVQPRYWGYCGNALQLADALAGLLWAELNLGLGAMASQLDSTQLRAHVFECWARGREQRLLTHLGDLHRHLAKEVESW